MVHSEMPDGHAAGIQLWINLPKRLKGVEPEYQQVDSIPQHSHNGVHIQTIVGDGGAGCIENSSRVFGCQFRCWCHLA
ncbi:MAG: hypothetical protein Q9M28_11035 [Mariprofundaceae bacterium]|nr:hypothetical protein [Mariprofundaceae bacterium]